MSGDAPHAAAQAPAIADPMGTPPRSDSTRPGKDRKPRKKKKKSTAPSCAAAERSAAVVQTAVRKGKPSAPATLLDGAALHRPKSAAESPATRRTRVVDGTTARSTSRRPASAAAGSSGVVGKTSVASKKKVPSLAPKKTPRKKAPNGLSLEINLAYIDSNPALVANAKKRPAPAAPPPDVSNLLENKLFDKTRWMDEQLALTNAMNSMYTNNS